jgi:hypothetical protein
MLEVKSKKTLDTSVLNCVGDMAVESTRRLRNDVFNLSRATIMAIPMIRDRE